jgi:hypothetical protein
MMEVYDATCAYVEYMLAMTLTLTWLHSTPVAAVDLSTTISVLTLSAGNQSDTGNSFAAAPYDVATVTEKFNVNWVNSTTSSITINWTFPIEYVPKGSVLGAQVEYFVQGGRFTSDIFPTWRSVFIMTNLNVATTYTICVKVYESLEKYSSPSSETSRTHAKCVKISTIPLIRKDSAVILVAVCGYFVFMGMLGFVQWRRKVAAVARKTKRQEAEDETVEDSPRAASVTHGGAMRWKDLEVKERLFTSGSAIEDNSLHRPL